jgi:hypothetical protein
LFSGKTAFLFTENVALVQMVENIRKIYRIGADIFRGLWLFSENV